MVFSEIATLDFLDPWIRYYTSKYEVEFEFTKWLKRFSKHTSLLLMHDTNTNTNFLILNLWIFLPNKEFLLNYWNYSGFCMVNSVIGMGIIGLGFSARESNLVLENLVIGTAC